MTFYKHKQGFTLIELMISLAIIGIIVAIGYPSYQAYIEDTCETTANLNLETLRSFEEIYKIENNVYLAGTTSTLQSGLRWAPNDRGEFNYKVTISNAGANFAATIVGTDKCAGTSVTGTDGG